MADHDYTENPGDHHPGGWAAGLGKAQRRFATKSEAIAYQIGIDTAQPPPPEFYVYFIQRGTRNGPVKIGHAKSPEKRLKELQTGAAERLTLLLKIPESRGLESQLHREFADHRLHGEWFEWCRPLKRKIAGLRKGEAP